ncbi:Hsp20/alpha crystallin family protein [Legionella taurinensis]|uniref:Heat-shock protein n=1 Tax=Legionella taurinensis TaxID=70611 RepID=A0A3A5LHS5_9GAMM|nr:Hsp20/alpha crystallin family protein [Legionella taurinensis]MDX1837922.1 Hsp20/alpha crystallin family protein [Legionella taurinensis]PUT39577.1 heat-shock protein [Legionella taurinensis]PUT43272.1 heat-shock protein [Legionella taurinensis]PUT45717.1 heat-shock protein [Legionella taurinensis]PUT47630.1 heat-shock protein [Legionella taurinensis]
MNIRSYYPLQKDLSNIFDHFFRDNGADSSFVDTGTWAPAVDIKEEKEKFLVVADIPGVNKDDIHIALENNVLTISGERKFESKEEKNGYSRVERVQGQFYRRFSLPQTADESQISATYKHGVLEISIPKKPMAVQKKIEVKTEE